MAARVETPSALLVHPGLSATASDGDVVPGPVRAEAPVLGGSSSLVFNENTKTTNNQHVFQERYEEIIEIENPGQDQTLG